MKSLRLFERNDFPLLAALTVALFVVFSRPLAGLLEYAHDIERSRDLQLLPGLLILGTVFVFHQLRKRHQMQAEAAIAATEARQATERAAEMERLVAFGQSLAHSLDRASIEAAAKVHIPLLLPGFSGDPLNPTPAPGLTAHQRGILAAAETLLAVSLKNAELFREVHESSVRDALTGCFNRRHALEVIDTELRRARRSQLPVSLMMLDLDSFKQINDTHGHLCGDAVLSAVGARIKAVLRGSDMKCRYGGEEFLLLLPDTPLSGARRVADTLRREIESHPVAWNGLSIPVTASVGVTAVQAGEVDALAIMARADAALYRAKQDGRNCVRVAEALVLSPGQSPVPL